MAKKMYVSSTMVSRILIAYREPLGREARRRIPRCKAWGERRARLLGLRKYRTAYDACLVTNSNEGSLTMGTQKKSIQPSLVKGGARPSRKTGDGAGYKLHLVLDTQSYAQFVWLQGALKATSDGEVLRRALEAYEIFDPEGMASEQEGVKTDHANSATLSADPKHLYILISHEMKEQLEEEKSAHGRTYKATIRRALCVLTQVVRERAKLVAKVKKGENYARQHDNVVGEIPATLLASL